MCKGNPNTERRGLATAIEDSPLHLNLGQPLTAHEVTRWPAPLQTPLRSVAPYEIRAAFSPPVSRTGFSLPSGRLRVTGMSNARDE